MRKPIALVLTGVLSLAMSVTAFAGTAQGTAMPDGASGEIIEISTAEELAAVNENLSGNYILTADIDLEGEEWTPLGAFVPASMEGEEAEIPGEEYAFTGTFDGNGHTINNLVVNQPEAYTLGLFGCIANADVGNFTVENASADGIMMVSDVVGYSFCSLVHDINLIEGTVNAHVSEEMEEAAEGMYGGIVGAGLGSQIVNCSASADIILPDGLANAGIIGGGLQGTSVVGCSATGTVTAGDNCYGLGGISGCGFGAEEFTDDTASDVMITCGDDCFWIGGITGYAGGYEDETLGTPVTVFTNCTTSGVEINTGANADGVGDIVGSGFYSEEYAQEMGEPFDKPTLYELVDCVNMDAIEEAVFEGGTGTQDDPWQVASADQLDRIRDDLTANYILIDDIDLSDYENWEPIGAFQSLSDAPEDAEVPHPDYAFTGSFDGNGHKISNMTIVSELPMAVGLFGCVTGSEDGSSFIKDFNLESINVSGFYLVGGAAGLQFMNCPVSGINLIGDNSLCGAQGIGGIVGTGFDTISGCTATADITVLGDDGACAGLIAGGTTMSPIIDCKATGGIITAEGNSCWGVGTLCGAPWGAQEITNCEASDTIITVSGEDNRLVGGLLGFGGSYDPENPAQISGCVVENVSIIVSDTTNEVGGLIGGGKEMMEGSDVMSSFIISECTVEGNITSGGEYVGAVVGDPACAVSIDCEGGMDIIEK